MNRVILVVMTFIPQGIGLTFPVFIRVAVEDTEISIVVWDLVGARVEVSLMLMLSICTSPVCALHAWKWENQFARPFFIYYFALSAQFRAVVCIVSLGLWFLGNRPMLKPAFLLAGSR